MAKNKRPNGRIFSRPRLGGSSLSLMIIARPIAKRTTAEKYGQNTFAGIRKAAMDTARRACVKNWRLSFSICIAGSPLRDSESQSPPRVARQPAIQKGAIRLKSGGCESHYYQHQHATHPSYLISGGSKQPTRPNQIPTVVGGLRCIAQRNSALSLVAFCMPLGYSSANLRIRPSRASKPEAILLAAYNLPSISTRKRSDPKS